MKLRYLFLSMLSFAGLMAMADYPAGYYNALDGKTGVALKKAAKSAVEKHTVIPYGSKGTWDAFEKTDVRMVNGRLCWWDMYSNDNVPLPGHDGLNIEHSVANSWWGGAENSAYKDLFLLNPSNASANSRKSNYPMCELGTVKWDNGVTFVGVPKSGQGGGSANGYEPCDEYKGDFARGFMYVFTVYDNISWQDKYNWMYDTSSDLTFRKWAYELLLKWAKNDPVSQKEVDRNEAVFGIQKNRNPYIDFPELCEYVWGSKSGEAFDLANAKRPDPTAKPIDPDPDDPDDPNDPQDPIVVPEGSWALVETESDLDTEGEYLFVASENENVMGYENAGKYFVNAGQAEMGDNCVTKAPDGSAVVKLIKSGTGYIYSIYDLQGQHKGYMNCTGEKSVVLATSESGVSVADMTISNGIATIDFGSDGKLYYNASAPRFTTYVKSSQQSLSLYKLKKKGDAVESIYESLPVGTVGNSIVGPDEIRVFDMQGREVGREGLSQGIYIVVTPSMNESVKVVVR